MERIYTGRNYTRAIEWGKLIAVTGSAQIMVQALGFICGILIIRMLPTHEYALYTLANTMLGTMTILADGGIATGVMYRGGRVWNDKQKLGKVLATGLDLRKKFAVGSLLIAIPVLLYLLRLHGASWTMTILLILSLIPAFFSALSGSLLEIVPKLHQNIYPVQKNQVGINIGRLLLVVITLTVFPWAFIAILGAGLPQIWGNLRLRKISSAHASKNEVSDKEDKAAILSVVKRTMPGAIYYCISGQITIWLISLFGTTESIAHIGALSRLTIFLNIIIAIMAALFEPRFSRLPNQRKIITNRFFQIQLALISLSALIILAVWMFPSQLISILGKGYSGLNTEVFLITISSCMSLISGSVYKLSSARGIVPPPFILIPTLIAIQVIFFLLLDLSKVSNVLYFSIGTFFSAWAFRVLYFLFWIKKKFANHEH